MNRIYSIIASLFTVWAFSACTVDDVGRFEFSEFGISQSEVIFPARAEYNDGKVVTDLKKDIQILSNQDCFVTYCDGEVDWMRIRNLEDYQVCRQIAFTGDCTFRIECDQNDDYARMVKLLVQTSSRTDTWLSVRAENVSRASDWLPARSSLTEAKAARRVWNILRISLTSNPLSASSAIRPIRNGSPPPLSGTAR